MTGRETPPQGPPPKPFHLPATTEFSLPNGLRVTIVPYGKVPKVAVRVYVLAGAANERADQVWLSKLTAALMEEGTRTRSAEQVAGDAADMGGEIEIGSGSDYTSVGGVVLSEFAGRFAALVADVLRDAALPESELARLKMDLLRGLAIAKTDPAELAREAFLKSFFPNHPYGRVFPEEAALQGYSMDAVREFFRANVSAARAHLYIAGKLEGDLRGAVEDAFAGWSAGALAVPAPPRPAQTRSLHLIHRAGAEQTNLLLGLPVAEPSHPDFVKLEVMNALLGGSFVSRITTNIREQKGYTYSPISSISTRRRLGYWVQSADVNTAVTGPALNEIFGEIERLRHEPPGEAELRGIQNYLAGLFVLRNTVSPDAIIAQLHFVDSQGLDRSHLADYVQQVMRVTPAEITAVARAYIEPSRMTIAAVGDRSQIAEQLAPFAPSL